MSQIVWTFPGGRLIDNFATLGAVATISFTVPAGKRWVLLSGYAERDQSATMIVKVYNSSDKELHFLGYAAAGTTAFVWGPGGPADSKMSFPVTIRAADYVKYTWGAAQTTPEVVCNILEIDE